MRRLALLLAACALAVASFGASSADAAQSPTFQWGAAHIERGRLKGWAVARNSGPKRSTPIKASIVMRNGKRARRLGAVRVPPIASRHHKWFRFAIGGAGAFSSGTWSIEACLAGQCRQLGQTQPTSTVPNDPIPHPVAKPFFHAGGGAEYWAFVPRSYDPTNQTPMPLLVWMHGCGGYSEGDAIVLNRPAEEGGEQDWMMLSLGGRDGGCWGPLAETEPLVMAALADFETHFNVDRRRVLLGGYSSGGDLAYRTGFLHSSTFAGLLIENSAPFLGTEASQAELLGAAKTKFHIVQLAHLGDDAYPIAKVRSEVHTVSRAGFPIELIERPGSHWDANTDPEILTYLLPHIDDGWLAP